MLSRLPLTLLSLLSSTMVVLPPAQVTALALSAAELGYYDSRLFPRQVSNLQTFTGNLGVPASAITNSGDTKRPFEVDGNTFTTFKDAAQRSCDDQSNSCADAANAGDNKQFTVADCNEQRTKCLAAQSAAQTTEFSSTSTGTTLQNFGPDPAFPDFDLLCEV